ncbi:MAG: glucosidase [Chloroflexi bacterium]|nr:MAG: glucosidase [Chloroflexota bacterium]
MNQTQEELRLQAAREQQVPWKKWGPYLSERQWGTVREDYSSGGDAWGYFTHDQARSRAYRWGEDGMAGISDDHQLVCFAIGLWNNTDPILKERIFGLTNSEGNHGEDVKEYYFYLDSTPTHSYMKYLYKYPQAPFPYMDLIQTNRNRSRNEFEYELMDTGIFNEDRYYDVFVEYAKQSPEDLLVQITVHNRGPDRAVLHLLPTVWFRNTWWMSAEASRPQLRAVDIKKNMGTIIISHPTLGDYTLYSEGDTPILVTENETNEERIFGVQNPTPYVKDGINEYVVNDRKDAVNPERTGTKASAHYILEMEPGKAQTVRLRLTDVSPARLQKVYSRGGPFGATFEDVMNERRQEADEFYASITPPKVSKDAALVMRQALASMLWTKQFYIYDVNTWLQQHGIDPAAGKRGNLRNNQWFHMVNEDIISMPDKWEYPWYAAWDLAFHTISLSMVDLDFAKQQLNLMLNELYLHPNGQIPAYEWNFSDVNPPVHTWATMFVYLLEKQERGIGDLTWLEQSFHKLALNFTWWVNRKDRTGSNVFEGGFLGLDNIGVFDRSSPLPNGGYLEQADGTAWMALFSQNMLQIALELAVKNPVYEEAALKYIEHFLWIAAAMDRPGENIDEMWDDEDGFYYDLLRFPDGSATRLKIRSMVGLLPLCAATVFPTEAEPRFPRLRERAQGFLTRHPHLISNIASPSKPGADGRLLLSILNEEKLRRVLGYMLDENEFLSPYGIRAMSRYHADHPYIYHMDGQDLRVDYLPAESDSGMFGGNSNWRGPIWMPVNALIIRALLNLYSYYGNDFKVEFPTGSKKKMNLFEVSREISSRLASIFIRDKSGHRAVYGGAEKFQSDPFWKDNILFYEYFHGDNGAGLGASHQTGWTGLIARLIQIFGDQNIQEALLQPSGEEVRTPIPVTGKAKSTTGTRRRKGKAG